ncbi:phage minor tail protein G [Salmonella enterica]|uniref:Phage minor tail protein G n=1 Tax=Salmonella enterica TaxID=28901 RepID=A0A5Y6C2J6_SALER|nr:phage minor tail protein G [Salmonella enterica]EDB9086174.1 phage minor tail protein G [Salmonella enterica subsp. enterica serovar Newport]EDP9116231.1 phage minor tail protein G [Salmonella enterica subsp. enterica]EDW8350240.1 phage minor tail protein G [Salmonella enterica subsp. enterica serovar 6,8:-:1,2]EDX5814128.1 phage minor tail protein G [Salmonella enterica subsp. enterica serovar Muenchen]EAS7240282.1 phage minor tail protein G [Salmonella enterica]
MFLKKDTLNYGADSAVLYELSGLQRVEYLEFLQKRTAKYDADMDGETETDKRVAYMQMAMEINAWLISRSLFNGDTTQAVDALYQSIQTTWSYEALDSGAEMVLVLSGLSADAENNASDPGEKPENMTPEKS